jgi:hypothetical protein
VALRTGNRRGTAILQPPREAETGFLVGRNLPGIHKATTGYMRQFPKGARANGQVKRRK